MARRIPTARTAQVQAQSQAQGGSVGGGLGRGGRGGGEGGQGASGGGSGGEEELVLDEDEMEALKAKGGMLHKPVPKYSTAAE